VRILLVEDDEVKRTQLLDFLKATFPSSYVHTARSLKSGLHAVIKGGVDVILLDMTMSTFDISLDEDGGRPQAYAGRELLRQMNRRQIFTPVIVVTQLDRFGQGTPEDLTIEALDAQLRQAYPDIYTGHVYYDAAVSGWQEHLAAGLRHLEGRIEPEQQES
jgi:DNA-binding NarL/FixJ family response regulator